MNEEEISRIRKIIKYTLIRIGFAVHKNGFKYQSYAIELAILYPEKTRRLCKGLYTDIATHFDVANTSVERDIRLSIDSTYIDKSFMEINRLFHFEIFTIDDKPKAGELIQLLAEYYNIGLYKSIGIDF